MMSILNKTQFLVLRCVYRAQYGITSKEIAQSLGVQIRTASDILRKLRDQSLVTRKKHINEPYAWYQFVTDLGQQTYIAEAIKRGELGCH